MISMMGVKTYSTYLAVYKLEFGDASVIPDEEAQARDVFAALEKKMVPQSRFNSVSLDVGRPCHDGLLPVPP